MSFHYTNQSWAIFNNIFKIYERLFPALRNDPWFIFLKRYTVKGFATANINNIAFTLDEINNKKLAMDTIINLIEDDFDPLHDNVNESLLQKYPCLRQCFKKVILKRDYFKAADHYVHTSEYGTGIFIRYGNMDISKFLFRLGFDYVVLQHDSRTDILYNPFSSASLKTIHTLSAVTI